MIEFLSSWAKNLGVTIVLVSIFEMLLPNNKTKKYIRAVLGVFVLFNIISPFINNKEKLSMSSIDLENYTINEKSEVNQSSMDDRIQKLYEDQLEKDIKNKLNEKGYNVTSCKVKANIAENEKSTITKIKLEVEKSKEEQTTNVENKIVTEVQKIKPINTKIENDTNEEKTSCKKISRSDIQSIKKFLSEEYGVSEKCLEIN